MDENEMMMKSVIRKGDVVCLPDLLFTEIRDYLVQNNNKHVKTEPLVGKDIVTYFVPIYGRSNCFNRFTALLTDLCSDCEVVFAAFDGGHFGWKEHRICHLQTPEECFEDIFSRMPWTAIPFSDIASRNCLPRSFVVSDIIIHAIFVTNSTGRVLQDNWLVINDFGTLGYPYRDERIKFLEEEFEAVLGKDTRRNFVANLYFNLDQAGIETFKDDHGLEKVDEISPASIVVISENYARSSWCLDELVDILGCKQTKNRYSADMII